jgi:hypothetical protein
MNDSNRATLMMKVVGGSGPGQGHATYLRYGTYLHCIFTCTERSQTRQHEAALSSDDALVHHRHVNGVHADSPGNHCALAWRRRGGQIHVLVVSRIARCRVSFYTSANPYLSSHRIDMKFSCSTANLSTAVSV